MASRVTQLEIPHELRVAAARSLEQAKLTFDAYMRVAEEAASMFEKRIEGGQVGTKEVGKKAIDFALQNATAAFERSGPGCLNNFSASISGASAGVRLPSGGAAG
jgi:hypothetical protein